VIISHIFFSVMGEASIIARCERTGTAGAVWEEWHNVAKTRAEIRKNSLWPTQTEMTVLDTKKPLAGLR
jgi:hypothetical protein